MSCHYVGIDASCARPSRSKASRFREVVPVMQSGAPILKGASVPFAVPDITDEEIQAVVEVLRCGWITTGPKSREFEREFAEYIGAKHALALNSCTAALHLALEGWGTAAGDEVLTSTITFTATAEVVEYLGGRTRFVDVE